MMSTRRQLFITATDTGVGKTLLSGLLLGYLREQGLQAGYQKWVATGCGETVADLERVRELAGGEVEPVRLDLQVPYRFEYPASPHLAAARAGREIDPMVLMTAYENLKGNYEILLVEGVGGVLVPLRRDLLLADLVARLRLPTLLVARSGLGTLNHTLLSLEALRRREIPLLGVLFTDEPDADETIAADNLKTISELGQVQVFGRLPWCKSTAELIVAFQPLGKAMHTALAVSRDQPG
ncbi:MAG: dethiobiotin synthase [Desulfobulbaceae bacterium]|nr:dethiobiotin synthase [Desulfobulbaceae bacterium]